MVYYKEKPMPPIDELPVSFNNVDPNIHVFITNKKNIHVNLPLDQILLHNTCDILIASSIESTDIALFTTKEGNTTD